VHSRAISYWVSGKENFRSIVIEFGVFFQIRDKKDLLGTDWPFHSALWAGHEDWFGCSTFWINSRYELNWKAAFASPNAHPVLTVRK
jgi:hypothetical protein